MPPLTLNQIQLKVDQAETFWRKNQFVGALLIYCQLLQERLSEILEYSLDFGAQDVFIAERTADLSILIGSGKAAESLLIGAVNLNLQAGNTFGAAYLHLKRILLVLGSGDLRGAFNLLADMKRNIGDVTQISFDEDDLPNWENYCNWGKEASNADKTVGFTLLYLIFGEILAMLGRYTEALAAINRGLKLTAKDAPDLAIQARPHLFVTKARIFLERGDLNLSDEVLKNLNFDENYSQAFSLQIKIKQLKGKTALSRGELGKALETFRDIFSFCEKYGLNQAAEKAALNLAHVLISLNQTARALEILDKLQQKSESDGNNEDLWVRIDLLRYLAQSRSGTLAHAVSLTVSKLWNDKQEPETVPPELNHPAITNQDTNYLAWFEDRVLAFHFYLAAHNWSQAERHLKILHKSFGSVTDSPLIHLRLKILGGILFYYKNEFARAETELTECCEQLREKNLLPELWQCSRILAWCKVKLNRPLNEQISLTTETERLLSRMTASLTDTDQSIFLLNKWTADEEALALKINLLARLKKEAESSMWFKRWQIHRQIRHQLHSVLEQIDRFKSELADNLLEITTDNENSLSLWQRLWLHPRDRVTILFLVLPDRVFIARIGWMSVNFVISAVSRLQLRDLVQQWHQSVIDSFRSQTEEDEGASDESTKDSQLLAGILSEKLQLPSLIDEKPKIKKITFVPDDCLHGFPFAAVPHKEKYLVEDFKINYAFTSMTENKKTQPLNKKALNVGVTKGGGDFPSLPGVRMEVKNFNRWLEKNGFTTTVINDINSPNKPEKSSISRILPDTALAHFACHGDFDLTNPANSGLVINAEKSEILTLKELSTMNLSCLRHITLSACWSADHHIFPGRRIIGLAETLMRVGTSSILGSYWQADDRATLRLMNHFYEYLETLPFDEALRQAQLNLLLGDSGGEIEHDTRNPYFWAGFALYGDCTRLQL